LQKRILIMVTVVIAFLAGLSTLCVVILYGVGAPHPPSTAGIVATARATPAPSPSPTPIPTPPPTPEPTPTPTPEPTPTVVKLSVTGDLMCHRWQYDHAQQADGTYDFNYAFQWVKPYLSDADWTIGNLETVFGGPKIGNRDYPMFNTPDAYGDALKNAGFDLLSTANNHSNDAWEAGILRTLEQLDALGIDHVGTYASQEARDKIYIKEIEGMTFAFVSYTYGTNGLPLTTGKPYLCNIMGNGKELAADIRRARAMNPDFVIVMPHMGNEYELAPKQVFRDWADLMFDAGADIILASHPHVLQPAEFLRREDENGVMRDCFIAYSLGNFFSSQRTTPRDAGVIMNLYFERAPEEDAKPRLARVGIIPTWVKFTDDTGAYDIAVLTVRDALWDPEGGGDKLPPKDMARLWDVHKETTKMLLGESVPDEDVQLEYILPGWIE